MRGFSISVFESMKKTGLLKLCQADKEEFSQETLEKIEKSKTKQISLWPKFLTTNRIPLFIYISIAFNSSFEFLYGHI